MSSGRPMSVAGCGGSFDLRLLEAASKWTINSIELRLLLLRMADIYRQLLLIQDPQGEIVSSEVHTFPRKLREPTSPCRNGWRRRLGSCLCRESRLRHGPSVVWHTTTGVRTLHRLHCDCDRIQSDQAKGTHRRSM